MGPWLLQATVHWLQALCTQVYKCSSQSPWHPPPPKTDKVWGAPQQAPCRTDIAYLFICLFQTRL
ncbi:mCG147643 [Mus musculus]|nr:mCG147643 [Mus musculus]